jgi:hypothetical protein
VLGDDLRKLGVFYLGGGWVGFFVDSDKMSMNAAAILFATGVLCYGYGLYLDYKITNASEDEEDHK